MKHANDIDIMIGQLNILKAVIKDISCPSCLLRLLLQTTATIYAGLPNEIKEDITIETAQDILRGMIEEQSSAIEQFAAEIGEIDEFAYEGCDHTKKPH
jgi:hypothetical protein